MSSTVKALIVSPKPPPHHGAARAVELLLEGCEGDIVWRHVDARYADDPSELAKLKPGKFLALLKYLGQTAVRSLRCRVVILTPSFQTGTFVKDSVFIWLCWLLGRRPIVAWYHMSFTTMRYESRPALLRWFVRLTLRRVGWHACVADRLLKQMPDFLDRDKVVALPNGIPEFQGEAESGSGLRVLYLSHLGEAKGWRVLLEAAQRICSRHPDVEFLFYGGPAYETTADDIDAAFAEVEHSDRIRHLGYADDTMKGEIFRDVDALCFPSLNEAFPITILEAMSAGLPIVASDVGGIGDALVHGEGGLLVPPGDSDALEKGLEVLIADPEVRQRWGAFNRERYLERYTGEAFCGRWVEFLKKVA